MPGNVVLVGLSGTGKSRVGRALAARLGRSFVDTDDQLVARFGMSIAEYFRTAGEPAFRDAESEAVAAACAGTNAVVSLGGGAIVRAANLCAARQGNLLVCLAASVETLVARLTSAPDAEERPLLAGDARARLAALERERAPIYAQADVTIATDGRTVDEVVDELARHAEAHTFHVGAGLSARIGALMQDLGLKGRAFLLADDGVFPHHGAAIVASLEAAGYRPAVRTIPGHESSKSLAMATELYKWLAAERAERRDCLVALGGGVAGDLGGFVAATYLRGMPVVQVPTTLLAQVDSAIGGKTAVNLDVAKNLVGAWHMPRAVVADVQLLTTLPRRQIVSGWTETIKHALIMSGPLLADLERQVEALLRLDLDVVADVVERSGKLKVGVVAEDPREQGRRLILNYGHTIGHAVELASDYGMHHGEAIAVGLHAAGRIGVELGVMPPALLERQQALLARFGLPSQAVGVDRDRVRAAMKLDKKVESRMQRWILLQDVARPVVRRDVPDGLVESVLTEVVR